MTIRNLSNISFDALLDCFLSAFENYYVKMPTNRNYYEERWKAAKVDLNLSYGMFEEDRLIGFIIHAIDKRSGILTAFNTGTGVLPEHRGKRIIKSIYEYALQDLRQNGVERSTLEVITENGVAIRAYESVGFVVSKRYRCYAGSIIIEDNEQFELQQIALKKINWEKLPNQHTYSWDFQKETILGGHYRYYQILNNKVPESFFVINPENQLLAQFDVLNAKNAGWRRLFLAIKQISSKIRIINVDERLTDKIDIIELVGLENSVNQYEMELNIKGESIV